MARQTRTEWEATYTVPRVGTYRLPVFTETARPSEARRTLSRWLRSHGVPKFNLKELVRLS
jgi:hypothetical protein